MREPSKRDSRCRPDGGEPSHLTRVVLLCALALGISPLTLGGQGMDRTRLGGPTSGWEEGGRPGSGGTRPENGAGAPLTLSEAVGLALASHPAVGQAQARLEAASARLRQTESTRLPWLAAQASLGLHQEPMIVAPIHSLDMTDPPDFDRNLLQGALTLGYTVFDGGGRRARIRQAAAGEEVAAASSQAADMEVILQVSQAFLGILSGQEVLRGAEGQRAALEAEAARVRQFLEEGRAARVDLLRVEAALSRVRASEISARADLELAEGRLARLTGLTLEAVRGAALVGVASIPAELPTRGDVLASADLANPDLTRAREDLARASAGVEEAKATWFPKLEAGGRYNDFGTLTGGHVQEWQALVQVSYPLFSGGSRSGDQARAEAEARQAAEALRLARLAVEDEAEAARAGLLEARALREAMELAVDQSEEVARIEALALEAGAGVQTDFLRAQAELFQARATLARAKHGEVLAHIQLARVGGELTLAWILENLEVVQ